MSLHGRLAGLSPNRLRLALGLFFLALAVPSGVLVYQAYGQLKWEAFHRHRVMAEELADRIRARMGEMVSREEARGFADYAFVTLAGDPASNYLARSPLSAYPVAGDIPGLLGYFQVDADGAFSTPLLPPPSTAASAYGVSAGELDQRRQLAQRIQSILGRNRLVGKLKSDAAGEHAPAAAEEKPVPGGRSDDARLPASVASTTQSRPLPEAEIAGQAAFDQLNRALPRQQSAPQKAAGALGRVDELKLKKRFAEVPQEADSLKDADQARMDKRERRVRKEQSPLPEPQALAAPRIAASPSHAGKPSATPILTFESEIDPFEFSRLESGEFVLFRKVWRDGRRYVQGLLIDRQAMLDGLIAPAFRATALSAMSDLIVAYRGDVFTAYRGGAGRDYFSSAAELSGELLYRSRLDAPLGEIELIFSINRLPAGPGARILGWAAFLLAVVLCGGLGLMYRLGMKQILLARQQQDFVSAVSHELKTPLTSIRMYGEMLREGWAPEAKKREYYEFIHDEAERLSRLINNVLQLARLTRNGETVQLRTVRAGELVDLVRSKIETQVARAGFELRMDCPADSADLALEVDPDQFTQILINLVDNAIKFSAKAERRAIDIACRRQQDGTVLFAVRDYGPGIPKGQMKKIFRLFYRSENELTRETVGTGIGLALVQQLASAMGGKVDVVNVEPGAEFRLRFPLVASDFNT